MLLTFPRIYAIDDITQGKNPIRQIGALAYSSDGAVATFTRGRVNGFLFQPSGGGDEVLIIPRSKNVPDGRARVVEGTIDPAAGSADLSDSSWLRHPLVVYG